MKLFDYGKQALLKRSEEYISEILEVKTRYLDFKIISNSQV